MSQETPKPKRGIRAALVAAREFLENRDRMNAALHDAPVRWSPLTEIVRDAEAEAWNAPAAPQQERECPWGWKLEEHGWCAKCGKVPTPHHCGCCKEEAAPPPPQQERERERRFVDQYPAPPPPAREEAWPAERRYNCAICKEPVTGLQFSADHNEFRCREHLAKPAPAEAKEWELCIEPLDGSAYSPPRPDRGFKPIVCKINHSHVRVHPCGPGSECERVRDATVALSSERQATIAAKDALLERAAVLMRQTVYSKDPWLADYEAQKKRFK